jgi:hypothetical protein
LSSRPTSRMYCSRPIVGPVHILGTMHYNRTDGKM